MSDIDLIPGEYRKGLALQRHLSRFVMGFVVVLGCVGATRAALGYLMWRERTEVIRIEQQQQELQQSQNQTEVLRQQRQVTEQQLAALDQLRGRDRVAQLLSALDEAYNDHIWLDSVHFQRRDTIGVPANLPGAGNSGIVVLPEAQGAAPAFEVQQGADIIGHATNHSELASFMQSLGGQPAVADLRLINTATRSYTSVQVIDFNLAVQMRGKVQP
jgi:cell division protein FtsB